MQITYDIHCHTHLSVCGEDSATIESYVRSATKLGLKTIGIADHMWDSKIPFFDDMRLKLNRNPVCIEHQQSKMLLGAQKFSPERDMEYRQYKQMGEELQNCLMNARQEQREAAAQAAAPKAAVTCPWCGATSIPDANGCCEYCGGAV